MKKLVLSMVTACMLCFLGASMPVFAGTFHMSSLVDQKEPREQQIVLQNLFKLFQLFKASDKKETPATQEIPLPQAREDADKQPRERASRGSAYIDRSQYPDGLSSSNEIIDPAEDAWIQDAVPADQSLYADGILPGENSVVPAASPSLESPASLSTPEPAPPADPTVQKSDAIIDLAKQYLGVRYVWGGTSPSGFDCSGFVLYLYENNEISLPRVSTSQYKTGTVVAREQLQRGDLVFFNTDGSGASHVGIYIGDGQFIHASSGAHKVTISTLSGGYYASHYLGARRVIG